MDRKIPARRYRTILLGLLCALAPLLLYWNVQYHGFIEYDDNMYILENPHIQEGFTWRALAWALQDTHTGHWHPLTWLSHILDWALFGQHAGGHHWMSLILHLANTLLVFFLFTSLTGEEKKSAFVAALFALHPVNVESVAWVAERKNVLSTFFWLATAVAYGHYVKNPGLLRYAAALFLFALGLAAKPMLVSLPFVLLLVDYWPLQRVPCPAGGQRGKAVLFSLVIEKIPFLFLSALSALITLHAARTGGALRSLALFPLGERLKNAFVSLAHYLGILAFPEKLAVFYPFAPPVDAWAAASAALLITAMTAAACLAGRRHRYLFAGWLWFLVTLLPVIGIVQVGYQAMADRYLYIPALGLFTVLAWGVPDLLAACSYRKKLLVGASCAVLLIFSLISWRQLSYWEDSVTLFLHALEVTENNHIAHLALGTVLLKEGRIEDAEPHLYETLRIKPNSVEARNNLGIVFFEKGAYPEATAYFAEAIERDRTFVKAYNNMGVVLIRQGRAGESVAWFQRALEIDPSYREAQRNLASVLMRQQQGRK